MSLMLGFRGIKAQTRGVLINKTIPAFVCWLKAAHRPMWTQSQNHWVSELGVLPSFFEDFPHVSPWFLHQRETAQMKMYSGYMPAEATWVIFVVLTCQAKGVSFVPVWSLVGFPARRYNNVFIFWIEVRKTCRWKVHYFNHWQVFGPTVRILNAGIPFIIITGVLYLRHGDKF